MPMGLNFTRFISYHDIRVNNIDLIEDAWGFYARFSDVIDQLGSLDLIPGLDLTDKLIRKIREHH